MKRAVSIIILAAMLLSLTGCFLKTGDELLSLPKPPEDYVDLQSWIDILLEQGAEYSAPVSGSYQQAVQLMDLDGDGVQEALAFMTSPGDKPLKLYIFKKDENGDYQFAAEVSGEGAAFDSVEYADVDGKNGMEIILGRQMNEQVLQYLTVYALDADFNVTELASGSYTEYKVTDLDSDGVSEVVLMRLDSPEVQGTADYYDLSDGQFGLVDSVAMSLGLENIKRIKTGYIEGGCPAIFASGLYQSTGVMTDVFAVKDGKMINVTLDENTQTSRQAIKNYVIYPTDVDSDGVMELARPCQMPAYNEGDAYYYLNWYSQDIEGQWSKKLTTYHNYSESWFFILPDQWEGGITVSRTDVEDEGKSLTFFRYRAEGDPDPLLVIYTFTGDDREQQATKNGRFVLYTKTDVIYAAEIAPSAQNWEYMPSQEELIQSFKVIRSEWMTGET